MDNIGLETISRLFIKFKDPVFSFFVDHTAVLSFISFLILLYVIYIDRHSTRDLYDSFKLEREGRKLKITKKKRYLRFENVKSSTLLESFWLNLLTPIGNINNEKFISVEIKKRGVNLYYDQLPESVSFDHYKLSRPMNVWLGLDSMNRDVFLDLQQNSSIYIDGKPGSGKSVAIRTILESYKRSFNEENIQLIVNIVTTKPADYFHLKSDPSIELGIVNPFASEYAMGEAVEMIEQSFAPISPLADFFKQTCEVHGRLFENLETIRSLGISVPTKRIVYVFDEAKDYLSKEKSDTKEEAQNKAKMITLVGNHIRRNARFLSTPIIVAAQVQSENDLGIPMKAFGARLYSSTNEALSRQYTGSNILTDSSFKKGKYYLKTDNGGRTLRVAKY